MGEQTKENLRILEEENENVKAQLMQYSTQLDSSLSKQNASQQMIQELNNEVSWQKPRGSKKVKCCDPWPEIGPVSPPPRETQLTAQPTCIIRGACSATSLLEVVTLTHPFAQPKKCFFHVWKVLFNICWSSQTTWALATSIPLQHFRPELGESMAWSALLGYTSKNSAKAQKGDGKRDSSLSSHKWRGKKNVNGT